MARSTRVARGGSYQEQAIEGLQGLLPKLNDTVGKRSAFRAEILESWNLLHDPQVALENRLTLGDLAEDAKGAARILKAVLRVALPKSKPTVKRVSGGYLSWEAPMTGNGALLVESFHAEIPKGFWDSVVIPLRYRDFAQAVAAGELRPNPKRWTVDDLSDDLADRWAVDQGSIGTTASLDLLRRMPQRRARPDDAKPDKVALLPLAEYDHILVSFSGGKDSCAAFVAVKRELEAQGASQDTVELWHQGIDPEGAPFMDWPETERYCQDFGKSFDVPILFQLRQGGFEAELRRETGDRKGRIEFDDGEGTIRVAGGTSPAMNLNARRGFPQQGADLRSRWCSGFLKIDVMAVAINNSPRLKGSKILVVTGERGEESPGRDRYAQAELHRSNTRSRLVHHWRPVLRWTEAAVWLSMADERIKPHPAYYLGYGRVSCAGCIFAGDVEWASMRHLLPEQFQRVADLEIELDRRERAFTKAAYKAWEAEGGSDKPPTVHGATIERPKPHHAPRFLTERADTGERSPEWDPATLDLSELVLQGSLSRTVGEWILPRGAFRHTPGPT